MNGQHAAFASSAVIGRQSTWLTTQSAKPSSGSSTSSITPTSSRFGLVSGLMLEQINSGPRYVELRLRISNVLTPAAISEAHGFLTESAFMVDP